MQQDPIQNQLLRAEAKRWGPIAGIFLLLLVGALVQIGISILNGDLNTAGTYAGVVSGISTFGLLLVTAWYTFETRRLVKQSIQDRKQEIELLEKRRKLDWYREIISILRRIDERWEVEFPYEGHQRNVTMQHDSEFIDDLQRLINDLRHQTSRAPSTVDAEFIKESRSITQEWEQMKRLDPHAELTYDHKIRENINILCDQLKENKKDISKSGFDSSQ